MSQPTPVPPELLDAQEAARAELRALRQESEAFFERRDATIWKADQARQALPEYVRASLRDLGSDIGLSAQQVLNIVNRIKSEDR